MEELFLLAFLCMLAGSGVFLVHWPVATLASISVATFAGYRWWQTRQARLLEEERIARITSRLQDHPHLKDAVSPQPVEELMSALEQAEARADEMTAPVLAEVRASLDSETPRLRQEATQNQQRLEKYLYAPHRVIESRIQDSKRGIAEAASPEETEKYEKLLQSALADQERIQAEGEKLLEWYSGIRSLKQKIQGFESDNPSALKLLEDKSIRPAQQLLEELRNL